MRKRQRPRRALAGLLLWILEGLWGHRKRDLDGPIPPFKDLEGLDESPVSRAGRRGSTQIGS